MRRGVAVTTSCMVPVWLTFVVLEGWVSVHEPSDVAATVANTVLLGGWACLVVELVRTRSLRLNSVPSWWRRPFVWLAAATVVSPAAAQPARAAVPVVVAESTLALSPSLAVWALSQILDRRRESVLALTQPRRLSDEELRVLALLRREARDSRSVTRSVEVAIEVETALPDAVAGLVDAAASFDEDPLVANNDWIFLVKVLGHPEVTTRDGRRVNFRKGRSLELAVWLASNRDRMSRSLARTAMWDVDVSDATFATVVSEMRRALNEAEPSVPRDEISPVTFTDDMHLHVGIVTDVDLVAQSVAVFDGSPERAESLAAALSLVRALPFAGTSYEWADLDGTTTRIVICVIDAAVRLGDWAAANSRPDLAAVALTSGLRVMPGHPELVRLEREILAVARG